MTYKNGAELILRNLSGGNISSDYPIEFEDVYIRMQALIPFLIKNDIIQMIKLGEFKMDSTFFVTFKTSVYTKDCEQYAVLPSAPMLMYGMTNPEVFYTKDASTRFTYASAGDLRKYKNINITKELSGVIFYYENLNDECDGHEHRFVFENLAPETELVKVRMACGVDTDNFNENAQIPLPPALENVLLEEVRKWFAPQDAKTNDTINNSRNDKI